MAFPSNRLVAKSAILRRLACFLLVGVVGGQTALAASGFAPQARLGYKNGDQWEPAMAADARGHLYVLYPQYGSVSDCKACTAPTIALLVSDDNGATWQPSRTILPFTTGQFDPQIVVDPQDRQTVYASWLQNDKRDVIVARSLDFGRSWSFSVAERGQEDADKPVLAVRGADVYVGFNHEERFFVAASHDAGQTFNVVNVNPTDGPGWSLAGGATVDPAGDVFFGWTAYAKRDMAKQPVSIYVSRSTDSGRSWVTTLLDLSGAPPACALQNCEAGYLGAQIALASDASGAIYAAWNAGRSNGGPERIYFSSSTTSGATWSSHVSVSAAGGDVEHGFPAIVAGAAGDVRIAWMDARTTEEGHPRQHLWNTYYRSSTNGGATWSPEVQLSSFARGYEDYILRDGFRFPFGDYFGMAIDGSGNTHAVWGEGFDYKSPGSIWYTRGR
ncbi:MAG TPA: sialidase family protein [Candidatus Sulfotelmatobacter sp.]|nr:sialidase family protein [Candidatus Sulfotelmatobacter sp.]